MQVAKILVFIMTAALVAGLGLLVYGMATKTASLGEGPPAFGQVELAIPAGAALKTVTAEDGLLYLHLTAPAGERVLVLEGGTGRSLGEIVLRPGTP